MEENARQRFEARLAECASRTSDLLDTLIGETALAGEIVRPARLVAAMRHGALNGGKRLRPFLLVEAARLFGRDDAGVLRAACALECVHCYSLVHDDLPAMDDDDLRRGQPTVHKAFDEATAILAGDALLTLAFDILASDATHEDPAIRAELVVMLARASGIGGMAGGQMLDLAAEGRQLSGSEIALMQSMKTGALLRFACEAGAVLAGAAPADRAALRAYGERIGQAFQLADDLLDVTASGADIGKRTGKDGERGKATLVSILGVEQARARADAMAAEAVAIASRFGQAGFILAEAARFTVNRLT